MQAFVKARGDGLAFGLGNADFRFEGGVKGTEALLLIDGKQQHRYNDTCYMSPVPGLVVSLKHPVQSFLLHTIDHQWVYVPNNLCSSET
jgi:hypothetical protein